MFYATWVEHTLTHLIFIGAGRTGLAENMAKQVIRETSLSAKLTGLYRCLVSNLSVRYMEICC